jgi:hypothetical protein
MPPLATNGIPSPKLRGSVRFRSGERSADDEVPATLIFGDVDLRQRGAAADFRSRGAIELGVLEHLFAGLRSLTRVVTSPPDERDRRGHQSPKYRIGNHVSLHGHPLSGQCARSPKMRCDSMSQRGGAMPQECLGLQRMRPGGSRPDTYGRCGSDLSESTSTPWPNTAEYASAHAAPRIAAAAMFRVINPGGPQRSADAFRDPGKTSALEDIRAGCTDAG